MNNTFYFQISGEIRCLVSYQAILTLTPSLRRIADDCGGLTDPLQIFDAHLFENINLSFSSFHFSMDFKSRSCFESDGVIAYSNEWG